MIIILLVLASSVLGAVSKSPRNEYTLDRGFGSVGGGTAPSVLY